MVAIKVAEFAFPRMEAPDLDEMEEFLTHFGLVRAERTPDALYMRGTDDHHHLHVTQKGGTKFIGFAYHAADEDDLKRLAKLPGASGIESINEPGGGKRVRLTEPNGYQVEVIAGQKRVTPVKVARDELNTAREPVRRAGKLMRLSKSPTSVQRIGHGVLSTPKVKETVAWFRETLGMIRSDDVYAGDKENIIGSFNRLDRGAEYVDHHVFFCNHNVRAGLNHVSYEVQDIDCVFQDHEYIKGLGKYDHMWGIGRHLLGSQVYDYWCDP
ncbi:MAG: glyoxalase, partial [Reyranella sp.]|nr:glyoxalase [Reyranella sp.]